MKSFCWIVAIVFLLNVGCLQEPSAPETNATPQTETQSGSEQAPVVELAPSSSADGNATLYLEQLRTALKNNQTEAWSLSQSAVSWSTLTVDLGDEFPGEQAAFDQIWQVWTEPVCSLTLEPDSIVFQEFIKGLIKNAMESDNGAAEDSINYRGFRFEARCSTDKQYYDNFFRFSFMDESAVDQ